MPNIRNRRGSKTFNGQKVHPTRYKTNRELTIIRDEYDLTNAQIAKMAFLSHRGVQKYFYRNNATVVSEATLALVRLTIEKEGLQKADPKTIKQKSTKKVKKPQSELSLNA